ncbi:Nrap protein [Dimargaris cristalligena]|uniref:U3 small nucleolar RNA-associated protein 22 n=1 Tax=Dimargaris cristalligena TaxID=215637 RepID=A0A4P9ZKD2_9FUNG|nr:Nrap protein [Dimargaris cristalligena]|eukprot:RKP33714.1 Nrap protein [Dimargaris cristalligena]
MAQETATDLYNVSLFQLQMEELLKEVRLPYATFTPLQHALQQLRELFTQIEARAAQPIHEAVSAFPAQFSDRVALPFPPGLPLPEAKWTMTVSPPQNLNVAGSFGLQTAVWTHQGFNVDMTVEMPDSLFDARDNNHHIYFTKRAYYLGVLAAALINHVDPTSGLPLTEHWDIGFASLRGDPRRPILIIRARPDQSELDFSATRATIRILPVLSAQAIPHRRLEPTFNSFPGIINPADSPDGTASTPIYNSLILEDALITSHLEYLYKVVSGSSHFSDACALAKVWLSQQGYRSDNETAHQFNGFVWSMLLAYLLKAGGSKNSRVLSNQMTGYQLFRGTLNFLATHDFADQPLIFRKDVQAQLNDHQAVAAAPYLFLDPTGKLNLLRMVSPAEMNYLQYKARLTMTHMSDSEGDNFVALFLRPHTDPLLAFDYHLKLQDIVTSDFPLSHIDAVTKAPQVNDTVNRLQDLLVRGLTDRVQLITIIPAAQAAWALNRVPPTKTAVSATVGLIVDPVNSTRLVDRGPSPEDEEAAQAFRKLWGKRAELRRFRDGTMLESTVWERQTTDSRALIIVDMVAYLFGRHCPSLAKDLDYIPGRLYATILADPHRIDMPGFQNSFAEPLRAFNDLVQQLKTLSKLPLSITDINPVSANLRYTSLFPPASALNAMHLRSKSPSNELNTHFLEPMEANLVLADSVRWPADLVTIQAFKRVFFVKLQRCLAQARPAHASVVVAPEYATHQSPIHPYTHLDIITASGFPVRLWLHSPQELEMLEQLALDPQRPLTVAPQLELRRIFADYVTQFVRRPWHHARIRYLCQNHPSMAQTIRLVKRWTAAHQLGLTATTLPEEALELIVAQVYLCPSPWSAPGSGVAGFFRTLHLLAHHDWKREPLIVNIEESMEPHVRDEIMTEFKLNRQSSSTAHLSGQVEASGPGRKKRSAPEPTGVLAPKGNLIPMYIATAQDTQSQWWTAEHPQKVVLNRLVALAQASLACVADSNDSTKQMTAQWASLLTPSLDHFDLLLHLNPKRLDLPAFVHVSCLTPDHYLEKNKDGLTKAHDTSADSVASRLKKVGPVAVNTIGFDPVAMFLRDLQAIYKDTLMFFAEPYGSNVVGALWLPGAAKERPLRSDSQLNTVPVSRLSDEPSKSSSGQVTLNADIVITEIKRLGEGVIKSITVQRLP